MTTDGEAFNLIHHYLSQYATFESGATVPLEELIRALDHINRRRPGTDVTIDTIRRALYGVQDEIVKDIRRR